jgi:hypothetical protein
MGASLRTASAGSLVYSVALGHDTRLVAAGCYDGCVRLFDVKTARHLVTLLEIAGSGDEGDWLAQTPEGYAAGSKALLEAGEWLMAGRKVPAAGVWKALSKPEAVSVSVRGETPPAPVFAK